MSRREEVEARLESDIDPVGKMMAAYSLDAVDHAARQGITLDYSEASIDDVEAILARLEATWPHRKDGERSQAWIDRQRLKIDKSLKAMSQGLGEKSFCSGIHLSLSDIAVGCALGYLDFRFPQIDWRAAHPNLARLYEKLSQRQSFVDTQPG